MTDRQLIIDCHIHAGELGKHYPQWWIKELYNAWGGTRQWAYGRENMTAGDRFLHQMDEMGIDIICIMTSDHRRVSCGKRGATERAQEPVQAGRAAAERQRDQEGR